MTPHNPKVNQLFKLKQVSDTTPHAKKANDTRTALHKHEEDTAIGDDEQDMDYETQDNL